MSEWNLHPEVYVERLISTSPYFQSGKIVQSVGLVHEAFLPGVAIGTLCRIYPSTHNRREFVEAEVIGFRDKKVVLMPFDEIHGVSQGGRVEIAEGIPSLRISKGLLGRVLDAAGNPIDGLGPVVHSDEFEDRGLYQKPSHPLERHMIERPLWLGIRAIDGLLTTGSGQRVGIMAGSGVGKSVLLGMMARNTSADINVIALIGERGREVREFIERDLGPEGLKRSVIIVATSDKSPLFRTRGAFMASAVAEYFRDQGSQVLLMMDSVTRFCMAQREMGLSMGEPPASKGYTPSVFSQLAKLLERAGTSSGKGSITGLYTVLVEGDDMDDPIADSARSILDGHIVLSRKIAQKNHFPAIDVLASASRVMRAVVTDEHIAFSGRIKEWISLYNQAEDLINIGAYVKGANSKIDQAVAVIDRINGMLRQTVGEKIKPEDIFGMMQSISAAADAQAATPNRR